MGYSFYRRLVLIRGGFVSGVVLPRRTLEKRSR